MEVCEVLELDAELQVLYSDNGVVMLDHIPDCLQDWNSSGDYMLELPVSRRLVKQGGRVIEKDEEEYCGYDDDDDDNDDDADNGKEDAKETPIHWVTAFPKRNKHGTAYAAYGNSASMGFAYGAIALIVTIGDLDKRAKCMTNSESA